VKNPVSVPILNLTHSEKRNRGFSARFIVLTKYFGEKPGFCARPEFDALREKKPGFFREIYSFNQVFW
jgi:hypothetical protein